jgi:hypothetical protein
MTAPTIHSRHLFTSYRYPGAFHLLATAYRLVAALMLMTIAVFCQTNAGLTMTVSPSVVKPYEVPHTRHLLGLQDMKRDVEGTLVLSDKSLEFRSAKATNTVEYARISEFTVDRESRAMVAGVKGELIQAAPFGSGKAFSMIRKGVDVLTIRYTDSSNAVHGCILVLPKGSGGAAAKQLEAFTGKHEAVSPSTDETDSGPQPANIRTMDAAPLSAVLIKTPTVGDVAVPLQFRMAIYENLISSLEARKYQGAIWREGDAKAPREPDMMTIETRIDSFDRGNERKRDIVPIWGATKLQAEVRVVRPVPDTAVVHKVSGKVRMHGEDIAAADTLSKNIAKFAIQDVTATR